ncbi:starvation-inducible outer membrane lipoprotein [Pseudomonas sp. EB276 TE3739]|nr:hypothetical protein [Pseudomonas koreensis]MCP1473891.1 starvation-inducible outer membrane lipoprotein [Pseudomonas koreensis]
MSNKLKLALTLIIASLLLAGCMPLPGEIPDLASCLTNVSPAMA